MHGPASRRAPAIGRLLAFQALAGVPLLLAIALYGRAAVERDLAGIEVHEVLEVGLGAGALERRTVDLARDLAYVVSQPSLRAVLEDATPERLARLNETLVTFSASQRVYDQVRWIDETGWERARVDLLEGRPAIVAPDALLDKSRRYPFREAMKLAPGDLYLSPLDLKVDGDTLAVPHTPILRVATPVADSAGRPRGVVMLNYLGQELIGSVTGSTRRHDMLVDREGYWLRGPTPADEWGFMVGRPDLTLGARFPEVWAHLSAAPDGQVRLDDGLWTWRAARVLVEGHGEPVSTSPGATSAGRDLGWRVVSHTPARELRAVERSVWVGLAGVGGLLLAVLGVGSWKLAQAAAARAEAQEDLRRMNADLSRLVGERTRVLDGKLAELDIANARLGLAAETLRVILASSLDGYWRLDRRGHLLDASETYCRQSGYPREELVGRPAWDLEHPHEAASVLACLDQVARDGHGQFECRHSRRDGSTWHVEASVVYHEVGGGEFVVFLRDITERKGLDRRLREALLDLEEAHRLARLGTWTWQAEGGALTWSPMVYALFELEPAREAPTAADFFAGVHPDDRARVQAAWDASLAEGESAGVDHRLRMADGRIKWVIQRWTTTRDESGRAIQQRGIVLDVTPQKEVEESLRRSEARFRDVALVSADWIWEVDAEARFTYASESVRDMLGYSPDEILGRTPFDFMPAEEAARVSVAFGEIALARLPFRDLENIMLAKDGRPKVTLTAGTPILGPGGELLGYRGVDRDVTAQRRMEEQVRQLAFVDSLTQLPNRRLLSDRLDQALASSDRVGNHGAVLFLDLDNFKPLNDEYGHDAGDALLVQVAERLRGCVRALDTVARLGGDEFVVVLTTLAVGGDEAKEQALRIAAKILDALAEPYRIPLPHGGEIGHTCTASIGVVLFRGHELGRDEVLRRADQAMYTAKTEGRNAIRLHPG